MKHQIIPAIKLLLVFILITGLLYPLSVKLFANILFPQKAAGSFIEKNGQIIGSELIGQQFTGDKYFRPRPSAIGYQPMPSGASNLSQASASLKNEFDKRKNNFLHENFLNSKSTIPAEMLFCSASGVDPHISPAAALLQVKRIVMTRGLNEEQEQMVNKAIKHLTELPQLGFLGEPVINVLLLNLELDKIKQ
jgi:K+-transporting ATPase ATPase C chain